MTTSDEWFPDSYTVQTLCETAAYRYLRPITWRLEQIAGLPPFSDFIDVRPGTDGLLVHERDPAEWAYLLVLYKDHPTYSLCGWIWGHEAKQPRFERRGDDGLAAFFVPLALAAKKARGERLGSPKLAEARPLAWAASIRNADAAAANVRPILDSLGDMSASAKAKALNERNVPTPRGGKWTARSVLNVLARAV